MEGRSWWDPATVFTSPWGEPPIFISTLLRTVFILPDTVIEFLDGWKFPSGPGYFVSEPNGQVKLGLGSD